jgi:hypothetical protein
MSVPLPSTDRSSLGRVRTALGSRVVQDQGDQITARCPIEGNHSHGDTKPSLSVTWRIARDGGGRVFLTCHSTGCGATADELAKAMGLAGATDLFDTPPARPADPTKRKTPSPPRAVRPHLVTPAAPAKSTPSSTQRGKIVAVYPYANADGALLMEVVRWSGSPKFTARRYDEQGKRLRSAVPLADRVLYNLPTVLATIAANGTVYLVEGEKDADAANAAISAAGLNAVATTSPFGATAAGQEQRKWLPQYTAALTGARVVLVVDRDDEAAAFAGQRHALYVRGQLHDVAADVRLVQAAEGKDAADHLDAGHELADLVDVDPDHLAQLVFDYDAKVRAAKAAAHPAPAPEDEPQATAPAPADPAGVPGRVLQFPKRPTAPDEDQAPATPKPTKTSRKGGGGGGSGGGDGQVVTELVRDHFEVYEGSLCFMKYKSAHHRDAVELIPGAPRLLRRLRYDLGDGVRAKVTHRDLEATYQGQSITLEALDDKEWANCTWVDELPWPAQIDDTSNGRSRLRKAIVATSGDAPVETLYGRLGWWEIDGRWVYLHARGAIDADGARADVRVHVSDKYTDFWLPAPAATPQELRKAAFTSLEALTKVPHRLAAPILCAAYRACLGYSRVTVLPVGGPTSGKTGLAAVGQQHYAPESTFRRLPFAMGEEQATVTSLEEHRYVVADMLQILDDGAPDKGTEALGRRQNLLARTQAERRGKDRGKRDGGIRPEHKPNGLLGFTAEQWVGIDSAATRVVPMPMYRGELDPRAVFGPLDAPGKALDRARLIATMVQHFAPRMPMTYDLRELATQFQAKLMDPTADPGVEARRADSFADLFVGAHLMLEMLVEREAFTRDEADKARTVLWRGLLAAKAHMGSAATERRTHDRAADLLRAELLRKSACLLDKSTGQVPENATLLGWEEVAMGGKSGFGEETRIMRRVGVPIGWTDGEYVYLNPIPATDAIARAAKAASITWSLTSDSLGEELGNAKVTAVEHTKTGRRFTTRVRVEGSKHQIRVWKASLNWLFSTEADEGDPDDGKGNGDDGNGPDDTPTTQPPAAQTDLPPEVESIPQAPEPDPELPLNAPQAAAPVGGAVAVPVAPQEPQKAAQPRSSSVPQAAAPVAVRPVAPAVVCAPTGAWLAQPNPTRLDVPATLTDPAALPRLLDWAVDLNIGWWHKTKGARSAYGQIWITPALRAALKLPADLGETQRDKDNRAQKAVRAVLESGGWNVAGRNGPGGWMIVYREGSRRYHLVVPEWMDQQRGATAWGEDEPSTDPHALAARLGLYADLVGTPYAMSPAVSGINLLSSTRPRLMATDRPELPPPALSSNRERDYTWHRAPQPDEAALPYAHVWDFNAMHLGAVASLRLGYGAATRCQHLQFDLARHRDVPGYWKIPNVAIDHARLPDPLQVRYRNERDTIWVTTPTMRILTDLYGMEVKTLDSYVWLDSEDTGEKNTGLIMDKFYSNLAGALDVLAIEEGKGNPNASAVLGVTKSTYKNAPGRLGSERMKEMGHRLYRPDFRHHQLAQARYAITRRIVAVAEAFDMYPLAIATDAVVYASAEADPAKAIPTIYDASGKPTGGFIEGRARGQVKHQGTAPMAEVAKLLASKQFPITIRNGDGTIKAYGLMDHLRGLRLDQQ